MYPTIAHLETATAWIDAIHAGRHAYVETGRVRLSVWAGQVSVTLIGDALKRGKFCPRYILSTISGHNAGLLNFVNGQHGSRLSALVAYLEGLAFPVGRFGGFEALAVDGLTIHKEMRPAMREFSPFNLGQLKPLPKAPEKWTLAHVVRALANGQFEDLSCNGRYSDDYAYDAASNYSRGQIADAIGFVQGLIEHPSGWWTCGEPGGRVSVCCHHFDSNSFVFRAEGTMAKAA